MSVSALGGCSCQMQRGGELLLRAGPLKTLSVNVINAQFYADFKH